MFALTTRRARLLVLALLATATVSFLPVSARSDDSGRNRLLVAPKAGADLQRLARDHRASVVRQIGDLPIYELYVESGDINVVLASIANDVRVMAAEGVTPVTSTDPGHTEFLFAFDRGPSPGAYTNQVAFDQVNVGKSSSVTKGRGIRIAVLDTGIDAGHPDLAGRVVPGYNAIDPGQSTADVADGLVNSAYGHGTMVAGILARIATKASIMPVRVLNGDGLGTMANVIAGVRWAVANGADVIVMCFGSDTVSPLLAAAVEDAHEGGVVLVASAGNGASDDLRFPAGLHGVTSVAAVNANDTRAFFSNYGTYVDYAAPGVGIRSTYPGGGYASWSGTSMAAPFVAGQASLLVSVVEQPYPHIIDWLMYKTARPGQPSFSGELGKGIINIEKSVYMAAWLW
ncbi:MAG: S8 family serine peptidase [Armatimonadetes bacterium]|nr:S8 family serine peptidase [Armatimonadota bacterium]